MKAQPEPCNPVGGVAGAIHWVGATGVADRDL